MTEVGAVDGDEKTVREWWSSPTSDESDRTPLDRYAAVFLDDPAETTTVESAVGEIPPIERFDDPTALRGTVLDRLGHDNDYLPLLIVQQGLGDY